VANIKRVRLSAARHGTIDVTFLELVSHDYP